MTSETLSGQFKALSFDVFGTIVDWESGIWDALQPLVAKVSSSSKLHNGKTEALAQFHKIEPGILAKNPAAPYDELLAEFYKTLAQQESVQVSEDEATEFANCLSKCKAFPDSIDALNRLQRHFKLIVLSNVDNAAFSRVLAGPLAGVSFDAVYTAEDIKSYKPDLNNFRYLISHVKDKFGVGQNQLLHVAHGLPSDHVPAKQIELESVWIARGDSESAAKERFGQQVGFRVSFETLGDMADAVEKEHLTK